MPITPTCWTCEKSFANAIDLSNHCTAKGHPCFVCKPCDRAFASFSAWDQHMNSSCHKDDKIGSAYLDGRDETEASDDEAWDNEDPFCASCNCEFHDMEQLNQHLVFSPLHNWCFVCWRDFSTGTRLAQHQASIVHESRNFKCAFCMSCFKSPSDVVHHVKSGCHKITPHPVTATVNGVNIVPSISIKRIAGPPTLPTTAHLYATEASFDGEAYKCYLCPKSCNTLASLNVHLNSAAHDDDDFRCPKCKCEFTVVSGFVQHLESEVCCLEENTQIEGFFTSVSDQFSRLLKF